MSDFSFYKNPEEEELLEKIKDNCYYPQQSNKSNFPNLRFNIRHIQRQHDGYCSEYNYQLTDNIENALTQIKIITFDIPVPKYLLNKDGLLKVSIDNNFNLLNCHETEKLFEEWTTVSNCDGSGCCRLYDSYIPLNIQYITN
jgi:hypothetical protein